MTDFRIPTRVRIAPGCSASLAAAVRDLGGERALLVTDPGLASGAIVSSALAQLAEGEVPRKLFSEVESNPRTTTAETIASLARPGDVIVGLGGGSVLDAAKAAAMLATNTGDVASWLGAKSFPSDPLPFIAIPTTCGTGSEVTWVAVLTDEARGVKISLKGVQMFPDVALVDADLIRGLPSHLIATTGLDALTHALEATTGSARNPVSDALAEKSIALSFEFLARAVGDVQRDSEAREAIMRASTLAGLAFGNADVAGVHCLSESLGGMYDVAHGLANALLLAPVFRAHGESVVERLGELARLCRLGESAEDFMRSLERLISGLDLPDHSALRIVPGEEERIAELAAANGSNGSNPRAMDAREYLAILDSVQRAR